MAAFNNYSQKLAEIALELTDLRACIDFCHTGRLAASITQDGVYRDSRRKRVIDLSFLKIPDATGICGCGMADVMRQLLWKREPLINTSIHRGVRRPDTLSNGFNRF
jgi:hypothetical protein